MASPNSSFTEISAITYRHFKDKYLADNVTNHTALYQRLTEKGRVDLVSGGWEIQVPLDYTENGTYQRYSGYDTLDVSQSEVFTAANFPWKQVAINVVASGLEIRQNSGKEGVIKAFRLLFLMLALELLVVLILPLTRSGRTSFSLRLLPCKVAVVLRLAQPLWKV